MKYPAALLKLISLLKKFPGVGGKSAERYAFHLLNWSEKDLQDLAESIKNIKIDLKNCLECGCLMDKERCFFCHCNRRDLKKLCVIASQKEVFLIEETAEYKGLYHVLGELFSPIHGKMICQETIDKIKKRVLSLGIEEVIIALDFTLEGDATSLFLKKELSAMNIPVSRLALGLPMGSALDYIDGGTLAKALSGRHSY